MLYLFIIELIICLELEKLLVKFLSLFISDLVLLLISLLLFCSCLLLWFCCLRARYLSRCWCIFTCTVWSFLSWFFPLLFTFCLESHLIFYHHLLHSCHLLRINLFLFIWLLLLFEVRWFGFNINHWLLSFINVLLSLFLIILRFSLVQLGRTWSFVIFRLIFYLFFSLRNRHTWEIDLPINLHSLIIFHHLIIHVIFTLSILLEKILKFSFKYLSLLFWEILWILLILLIELLENLIFLFFCELIICFLI